MDNLMDAFGPKELNITFGETPNVDGEDIVPGSSCSMPEHPAIRILGDSRDENGTPTALLANVGTAGTDYYLKLNQTGRGTVSDYCARGSTYLNPDEPASGATSQGFVVVRTQNSAARNMSAPTTVKLAATACRSTNGTWGLCAALDEQRQALVLKSCASGGTAVSWTLLQ